MKFKLDENMPLELASDLRALGHDADTVLEEGLLGKSDPVVVGAATSAGRILLTLDKGIADLRDYPLERHPGVVLFRPERAGRKAVRSFVWERLSPLLQLPLEGRLTIVAPSRIRIRGYIEENPVKAGLVQQGDRGGSPADLGVRPTIADVLQAPTAFRLLFWLFTVCYTNKLLPDNEFQQRRARLLECFPALGLDSFLVTHLPNVHYLTGFTGSNAMLLAAPGHEILFTDPRYTIQAAQESTCKVVTVRGPMLPKVVAAVARYKLQMLGLEALHLAHLTHQFIREKLPLRHELKLVSGQVEQHRMVKSASELARIERAVLTNSRALDAALKKLRPGMSEMDLAAEIDYRSRREGASGPSFETIVASGVRAALPHARPSANPIEPNQLLLIDMGATREGYTSDMTRTLGIGKPSTFWKQTYRALLESQLAAIDAIRPGVKASEPDRAARQVLQKHGLEKTFTHSTGHGLGLEIHEAPRLGRKEKTKLLEGMVVTVEPGVYLEGKGGIRIEDTVLVTRNGCRILTPTPKEWMVL